MRPRISLTTCSLSKLHVHFSTRTSFPMFSILLESNLMKPTIESPWQCKPTSNEGRNRLAFWSLSSKVLWIYTRLRLLPSRHSHWRVFQIANPSFSTKISLKWSYGMPRYQLVPPTICFPTMNPPTKFKNTFMAPFSLIER